jgi:hypothetical protein
MLIRASDILRTQGGYSLIGLLVAQNDRQRLKGAPFVKKHRNFDDMGAVVVKRNNRAIVDKFKNLFHNILLPNGGIIPASYFTDYSKFRGIKFISKCL